MYFYLIGIDYKKAPQGVREHFYCQRREISDFWEVGEATLLATCNRIEIYGVSDNADNALSYLAEFSRVFPDFFRHAYIKYGEREVFRHALRLASGLESQLEGELQILQQLIDWRGQKHLPSALNGLWKRVLLLAKDIRAQSGLNDERRNIAAAVYADLGKRLVSTEPLEIIVVGTGKIAGLFAQYRQPRTRLSFVAHKNYQKARALAMISQGKAFLWEDLAQLLSKADVLISATSSPHYVLKGEDFFNLRHPLYIYDLALPRDIEPMVRGLPGIFLSSLDDLADVIHQFNRLSHENIHFASRLVEEAIERYPEVVYAKNY